MVSSHASGSIDRAPNSNLALVVQGTLALARPFYCIKPVVSRLIIPNIIVVRGFFKIVTDETIRIRKKARTIPSWTTPLVDRRE